MWRGRLSDGRTARAIDVEVRLTAQGMQLARAGSDAAPTVWLYNGLNSAVAISARSTDVLVATRAQPGASLFVDDAAFAAALKAGAPHLGLRAARVEGLRPGLTVGAIAFSLTALVFALDLSPSKGIARMMPQKARSVLGQSVLGSLPPPAQSACRGVAGTAAMTALATRLLPGDANAAARITVVEWNVLNAFAIPGGRVIITRRIVADARSPDELAGVIAHELGHGLEFHPEAGLVRSVGFWALIQMMFTGTPGAIGNAGTILATLAYTRAAEREADDHALTMLKQAGISPRPFADFFRRIGGQRDDDPKTKGGGGTSVFSTHPATPERIAKIEGQAAYQSTPALDYAQWQALKAICGDVPASQPVPQVPLPGPQSPKRL